MKPGSRFASDSSLLYSFCRSQHTTEPEEVRRKTVARKLISSEVDSISPDSQSLLSLQSFAGGTPCSKLSGLIAVDWMSTKPGSMPVSELPMQISELSILKLAFRRFKRIYDAWLPGFRSISVRKSAWNLPVSIGSRYSMYLRKPVK